MRKRASEALLILLCTGCSQSQPPTMPSAATTSGQSTATGAPAPAPPPALSPSSVENKATAPIPDVGRIETVPVRAEGRGSFPAEAVDEAIKAAILQVNGKTIDLSSEQFRSSVAVAIGRDQIALQSGGFAQLVSEHSRGAVTNFKIVSLAKSKLEGVYVATIEANIARFRGPEDSRKLKVVIAPLRSSSSAYQIGNDSVSAVQVAEQLHQQIINQLTQTGRFVVIDRDFAPDVANELDLISSGQAPVGEFAKIGQSLSADLVWVGRIDSLGFQRRAQKLPTSDRQLVSYSGGARMSDRLINVATRQILLSDSVTASIPPIPPTTFEPAVDTQETLTALERSVAAQVVPAMVLRMYPIAVVSRTGDSVVLSQGGPIVREHASYEVVLMGEEMKDPQTGQDLGRAEEPCCVVDVTRVTATMSYGTLRNLSINLEHIIPGGLQLRHEVLAPESEKRSSTEGGTRPQTSSLPTASRKESRPLQPAAEASDAAQKPVDKGW